MREINVKIKPFLQRVEGVCKIEAKGFLDPQISKKLKPKEPKSWIGAKVEAVKLKEKRATAKILKKSQ